MNEKLRETIKQLRSSLVALDDGPRIGEIRPGNADARCEVESWDDVLVECDGGRLGAIDLWSAEEIPSCQQAIQPLDNASDYLVVGQILYEPIVINRRSKLLHWLPVNAQPVALGTADLFLNHFVFGSGYSELIPNVEKEHWWQFLSSQRIT